MNKDQTNIQQDFDIDFFLFEEKAFTQQVKLEMIEMCRNVMIFFYLADLLVVIYYILYDYISLCYMLVDIC